METKWYFTNVCVPDTSRTVLVATGSYLPVMAYYNRTANSWYTTPVCDVELTWPMAWTDVPETPIETWTEQLAG